MPGKQLQQLAEPVAFLLIHNRVMQHHADWPWQRRRGECLAHLSACQRHTFSARKPIDGNRKLDEAMKW
jgi:hypothetical protein